jgi:hypothetical protein
MDAAYYEIHTSIGHVLLHLIYCRPFVNTSAGILPGMVEDEYEFNIAKDVLVKMHMKCEFHNLWAKFIPLYNNLRESIILFHRSSLTCYKHKTDG